MRQTCMTVSLNKVNKSLYRCCCCPTVQVQANNCSALSFNTDIKIYILYIFFFTFYFLYSTFALEQCSTNRFNYNYKHAHKNTDFTLNPTCPLLNRRTFAARRFLGKLSLVKQRCIKLSRQSHKDKMLDYLTAHLIAVLHTV